MTIRFISLFQYSLLLTLALFENGTIIAGDAFNHNRLSADSLKNILKTQSFTERQQLKIYSDITGCYASFAIDSVLIYAPKAIELARKLKDEKSEISNYYHFGAAYCFRDNYDSAFVCFNQIKELAAKSGDKQAEATALQFIAFAYARQGKYLSAIDFYTKSLKALDENQTQESKYISTLINLAELYRKLNNTDMAIQYLAKSEKLCNKIKSKTDKYNWDITQIYNEYAYNYLKQGNLDMANEYASKSDSINLGDYIVNKCYSKILLATINLRLSNYNRALQYAKESYHQADLLKDRTLYADAEKIMSDVYLALKRYPEAEAEAFKVWQSDSTSIDEARSAVMNIALANIYMGNKEKTAYYFRKYSNLNDQYSEKSFQTAVSDLAIKYETKNKEALINSLEREQQLYVWLSIIGLFLIVALAIALWQSKRNERKERQLIATKALQDGELSERTRIAEDIHDRLGGSLSAMKIGLKNAESLQNVGDKLDECIKEVREITHNLMPRSLRLFGMKGGLEDFAAQFSNVHFHFFGKEKRISDRMEFAVYCCASELITNSLRHSGAENINVQLVQDEKYVSFTVQDDGCGFDEKKIKRGIGLKNIQDRVASYNGKLDIASSPGNGTETTIELKVENGK